MEKIRGNSGRFLENQKITKWVKENQNRYFCICGCNQSIVIRREHYKAGVPKYIPGHNGGKNTKDKTYEEIHGIERAEIIKTKLKTSHLGYKSKVKGKTYEEIHGEENAKKLRKKLIIKHTGKKGKLSSNWQGGKSFELYGLEFNEELKQRIKERDEFKCQECGASKMESRLVCHHIDYDKKNNREDNLITLCNACNLRVNGDREKWTEWFKFKMLKRTETIIHFSEAIR